MSAIDPQLAVDNVRTMETLPDNSAAQSRVTAWLVGMFAILALLLAAIGVYGVLAYLVTQRTREIGLRIALGARPGSVLQLVVGHSLRLSVLGIAIGVVGALMLGPSIESQLYGVEPRDAATLAAVAFSLLTIAIIASYIPPDGPLGSIPLRPFARNESEVEGRRRQRGYHSSTRPGALAARVRSAGGAR